MSPFRACPTAFLISLLVLTGCQSSRVKDIDGNRYSTMQIGEQVWMAENLRTTRYNDGTPISKVTGYEEWAALETPAYCWYNNDSVQNAEYGALYNWYAVDTERLCPDGWHVPSDEEWNELTAQASNPLRAGGSLKESGTEHWRSPNTGATNATGFTALPGGYRSYNGTFNLLRASGYWWTATEGNWYTASTGDPAHVIFRALQHDNEEILRHISEKSNGFSVRCVKNR